jgi:hypothetical protein
MAPTLAKVPPNRDRGELVEEQRNIDGGSE